MYSAYHRVTLEDFYKFKSTADAFKCISKLMKGKIPKSLSKFLSKNVIDKEVQETIAIADKRLGKALTKEMSLEIYYDTLYYRNYHYMYKVDSEDFSIILLYFPIVRYTYIRSRRFYYGLF